MPAQSQAKQSRCIFCGRDSAQVPLIQFIYKDEPEWICPTHLPILIHKPGQLADKLPGLENMGPPEGHQH